MKYFLPVLVLLSGATSYADLCDADNAYRIQTEPLMILSTPYDKTIALKRDSFSNSYPLLYRGAGNLTKLYELSIDNGDQTSGELNVRDAFSYSDGDTIAVSSHNCDVRKGREFSCVVTSENKRYDDIFLLELGIYKGVNKLVYKRLISGVYTEAMLVSGCLDLLGEGMYSGPKE